MNCRKAILGAITASLSMGVILRKGEAAQTTYVLVHGSWMSGTVWDDTATALRSAGAKVIIVNLPAHGDDPTPAEKASLQGYVDAVVQAAAGEARIVLVGHSFGGLVISAAAEAMPQKVDKLIYVAGYLPQSGDSAYSLSQRDKDSLVSQFWHQDDPAAYSPASIAPQGIVPVFCADCPADKAAWLANHHRAEPVPPLGTPITLSAAFEQLPKAYIVTQQDKAISPALQKAMYDAARVKNVATLQSSHTPMLSMPDQLAKAILRLSK